MAKVKRTPEQIAQDAKTEAVTTTAEAEKTEMQGESPAAQDDSGDTQNAGDVTDEKEPDNSTQDDSGDTQNAGDVTDEKEPDNSTQDDSGDNDVKPSFVRVFNNSPSQKAFPVVNQIIEPFSSVDLPATTEPDRIKRLKTEAESLNEISGYEVIQLVEITAEQ